MASKTPASQVLALHEPLILTWAGPETGWAVAPWLWYVPQQGTLRDVVMFTIGCAFTLLFETESKRPNLLLTPQSVYSPALIGVVCVACYAVMQKLLMLMLTTVCRTR